MKSSSWFGCSHQFSFPIKLPDGTYYQVCIVCGAEYGYDWQRMRRTKALLPRSCEAHLGPSPPEHGIDTGNGRQAPALIVGGSHPAAQFATVVLPAPPGPDSTSERSRSAADTCSWNALKPVILAKRSVASTNLRKYSVPAVVVLGCLLLAGIVFHRTGPHPSAQNSQTVPLQTAVTNFARTGQATAGTEAASSVLPSPVDTTGPGNIEDKRHGKSIRNANRVPGKAGSRMAPVRVYRDPNGVLIIKDE